MSRIPKIVGMLALTAAFLLSAAAAPGAEKDEKKRRRNYIVGEYTYKKLAKIAEHMEVEEYVEVRKILDQMSRRSSLNPHEKALMWQMYGYLEAGLEDFDAAVVAFEKPRSVAASRTEMPGTARSSLSLAFRTARREPS